jgi:hypothetical protein
MPPKKAARNWNDIQMAITAVAMTLMLALWNLFAGPDREAAARKAAQEPQATPVPTETPLAALTPTPMPIVKIIFGNGAAPQSMPPASSSMQSGKPKKNRDDGGGGGGGGGASTRSS